MHLAHRHELLALILAAAALGACGGATTAPGPQPPGGGQASVGDPPPKGAETGSTPPGPGGAASKEPAVSTPLRPTQMSDKLTALGLDPKKLPELKDVPLAQKKKLMGLFNESLGVQCTACHDGSDYKKDTHHKRVARGMWAHFVRELRDEKGGVVFCDSCHGGKEEVLARGDKEAMQKFMKENYEDKLTRADGKEHGCATCHGDEMEVKVIEKRWGIEGH